jgi:hypothetical protein
MDPARHPCRRKPRASVRWTAAGCALLVWVLGLLATSPTLHGELHDDADHAHHICAITNFHQGVEDTDAATPQVSVVWRLVERVTAAPAVPKLVERGGLLPPSCGPPTA